MGFGEALQPSRRASRVLRYGFTLGLGMVAAQLIAVGGVLVADAWARRVARG